MSAAAERILVETLSVLSERRLPESTYRLQFHAEFTFRDATEIVAYLSALGITDCYASPYLKARPGSRHGYDITDHSRLNPELGSEDDYRRWCSALKARGMGQILDIVPNHMAVVGNENAWWNDLLENGSSSPYAHFFDVGWSASPRPEMQGRILIPILGELYSQALESQRMQLHFENGAFAIRYFEHRFPVAPRSYESVLQHGLVELEQSLEAESPALSEFRSIITAVKHLPLRTATDPASVIERQREKEVIKRRLAAVTADYDSVRSAIENAVASFNGLPGRPESFDRLDKLLDDQAYRLAFWRVAADEINYRRFFDVNELAALNMEREEVFAATHDLVFRLLTEESITGLRVDHPDGLYDPRQYLERLQQHFVFREAGKTAERTGVNWDEIKDDIWERIVAEKALRPNHSAGADRWPLYVVVEKILEADETLRDDWPTCGATGYEFLKLVNGLFVATARAPAFSRLYRDWIQDDESFAECAYRKKSLILQIALSSELQMLTYQLDRLAQRKRWSRDFTQHSLRQVLRAIISSFPVYRTYVDDGDIHESDRKYIIRALHRAIGRNPAISVSIFQFVRDTLLLRSPTNGPPDVDYNAAQRQFAGKFQQVTAPVMAKGVEDTAFYIYNRLLSLNEVGSDPDQFGTPPDLVHRAFQDRRARHPWSLSTTSTHDTKRSEDVRARLNVLSELPEEWSKCLARWSELNRPHRIKVDDEWAPDANEEYLLYQTLLGAWPIEPIGASEYARFVERIQAYLGKALQEAKVHTSWINPNAAYDDAVRQFVGLILDPAASAEFLADFRAFQKRISHVGVFNSLAQTLVKIAAPGVADFYQGTELWDFSLVDPDNRRRVDFTHRKQLFAKLRASCEGAGDNLANFARELTGAKEDGRIKMYTIWRGLHCRRDNPGLFTQGEYRPVEAIGEKRDSVFSFVRRSELASALVIVPRLLTSVVNHELPLGQTIWGDTAVVLSGEAARWRNVFTGEVLATDVRNNPPRIGLANALGHFPIALFVAF